MKLKQAERRYKASATSPVERAAGQALPRSASREVRGNVEQQLRREMKDLKYELNRERSAGFERDKDNQRIRRERAELRQELKDFEETKKIALEQGETVVQLTEKVKEVQKERN